MSIRGIVFTMVSLAASSLSAASPVHAQPSAFGANAYEYVEVPAPYSGSNNSWSTARDTAAASIYRGVNGHLATIESQEENDFLFSLAGGIYPGFTGAWIGARAPDGWLVGPEAGQSFTYTNWGGVEPNNMGFAYMNVGNTGPSGLPSGTWADDSGLQGLPSTPEDPVVGYFIEYEGAGAQSVPALGTAALVLLLASMSIVASSHLRSAARA